MKKGTAETEEAKQSMVSRSMNWERAIHEMTEDEVEKFKNMNWEWYYNCYLHKNEIIEIMCKICGGINIFQPGEMEKKCIHCGIECRRCEVDEDEK